MGVPGLFPYIVNSHAFSQAITSYYKNSGKKVIFDYVYLDANGLLHGAAQTVYNYGEKEQLLNPYQDLSLEEKRLQTFELFFDHIKNIISIIIPRKVLYIAIDGPAPRAKQAQQRQRRFISAKSSLSIMENGNKEETLLNDTRFSSVEITPGTEFMHELSKFMYWKIRSFLKEQSEYYAAWRNVEIIYSPPTVPGEGEHIIMDYIRSLPQKEIDTANHCMVGPDGDLLILMLSSHVKNMFLFKEDQHEPQKVHLVNTKLVRYGLVCELNFFNYVRDKKRTENDISNDFALISFFVGNDFLPIIKMFYNLKGGVDKMFEIYNRIKTNEGDRSWLTKNNVIQIEGLRYFINALSNDEISYIADQAKITALDPIFIDNTLLQHAELVVDNHIHGTHHLANIRMADYREAYYIKAGCDVNKLEDDITKMCYNYLFNIGWVYKYYTQGLPSWDTAYLWHYAPLMRDLAKTVNLLTQTHLDELLLFPEKGHPALPFEQLLSVLPPTLNTLLPKHYRSLMTDPHSPLVKAGYYPRTFTVDYEGKYKEHQGIAILPFVDYDTVSTAYEHIYETDSLKYHRNEFGKDATFKWKNPNEFNVVFTSQYGEILDCNIQVI